MKKIILILMVLSIFFLSLLTAYALPISTGPDIKITLQSQDPDPVEPGQIIIVKFKVENDGKETTHDALITLLPAYPFKLYGDVAAKNIGRLRAGSTGSAAVIVEYKLKVDEAAVEGDTELELKIVVGDSGVVYKNNEFLINIQTQDPVLEITSVRTVPEHIAPGSTAELQIFVKNLADSLLKDIKFSLDFSSPTLPLAPYQTSSLKRVPSLDTDQQLPLTFNILADPGALPGLYKIPVNITYNDENGNRYIIRDVIAVLVGDAPDIKAYLKKSTVQQSNKAGVITLELANTGTNDIKFMELILLPSEDYQLISPSDYFYIGDVDSDDTESEDISIFINRGADQLRLPVLLRYRDANNQQFEKQVNLEMGLYSSWTLKKFGILPRSTAGYYLLLLLLAGGGYFYYIRYYKKRKKKP